MSKLYVAHYGHPLLKGAKHWALLLPTTNQSYVAYQISGSTDTYEVKPPEDVRPAEDSTYLGKVEVGHVENDQREKLEKAVQAIAVTRGDLSWNCQNWIIEVLGKLKAEGFAVTNYSLRELQDLLAACSK
ncbi:hypothetical protein OE88DRAFT_1652821 [Heliocybe sulcata]|uniref:Uncharacterized protein n=1 Tax=Heliocybe sulcata TaxID=5364 RepID=A0A5C3NI82_9AGAM|nr:hypothetical protein OE88DRAFT_1652821 [Heliocybe sulcata]